MDDLRRHGALRGLLRRLSTHSAIDAADEQAILGLPVSFETVKTHWDLVRAGTTVRHSCVVEDGLIARYEQFADGRRQILSLHIPGDFFDLQSFLLPVVPTTMEAICVSTIARIPHEALRHAITERPSLGIVLWRDTASENAVIGQALARIGRQDSYARTAHLLCEMAVRYARSREMIRSAFRFPITQEHLGDVLGLTSVHVNRTLRALREDRLVEFSLGKVVIHDWPALQRAAEFNADYLQPPEERMANALA